MTDAHDKHSDPQREAIPAGKLPTWPLPPPRVPSPPQDGGHPLRWVLADPETLARVRAALRRL